ncbi:hypothetical protein [Halobacillus sp. BBL2006]|uniref:hypothetical protein n=1 Tax=Halobacillus sp. BBL2006 TaxID=1543706 RepID=UPI000543F525|nr:hypothetical protein [Halobacillus sp. BBL2006]KHE72622.1 hypothetical protein LD39_03575 [Halobacillus sp. BBL2006]
MPLLKTPSTPKALWITLIFFSLVIMSLINLKSVHSVENLTRSTVSFIITPCFILFANRYNLWFRRYLRWVVHYSQRLLQSTAVFFLGTLVSFELSHTMPKLIGYPLHMMILLLSAVIYWSPLLLHCTFRKPLSFMHKFAYFSLTTILFFAYHEGTYYFYGSRPISGYLYTGLFVMLITLWLIVVHWYESEKDTDRMTVEGYVHPLPKEKTTK